MQNIKQYLYFLVLKTYLIDKRTEIILDDKYFIKIDVEEDIEWVEDYIVSNINFLLNINNENEIIYTVTSQRSLADLLSISETGKLDFIFKRKFLSLDSHYRIKMEGKIMDKEICKEILKETAKHLETLKEKRKTKIKKNKRNY